MAAYPLPTWTLLFGFGMLIGHFFFSIPGKA
jgi:hypothetical protein